MQGEGGTSWLTSSTSTYTFLQLFLSDCRNSFAKKSSTVSTNQNQNHLPLHQQCSQVLVEAFIISFLDYFIIIPIGPPISSSLCKPPSTLLPKWSFWNTNSILVFGSTGHLLTSYHFSIKLNFIDWHLALHEQPVLFSLQLHFQDVSLRSQCMRHNKWLALKYPEGLECLLLS